MLFKSKVWLPLTALILLMALTACTDKTNPTGNNWSNVRPITFEDSLSFDLGFSYGATPSVLGTETNLLCGSWQGNGAVSAMHFTAIPDSFNVPTAYVDSTYLELTLIRRSPLSRNPVKLSLYSLNQYWKDSATSEILDANMTLITPDFQIPDSISTSGTDIRIPIPVSFINGLNAADKDSVSFAVKCSTEGYVEMRSLSTGRGPLLRFKYKAIAANGTVATTDSEYKVRAVRDSYRIDAPASAIQTNVWEIRNLNPSRFFVRWVNNWNMFVDNSGNILTELQRKRATINKAELVFYVKQNPYYASSILYSLRADRVERDTITTAVTLADADAVSGLSNTTYVRGDSVVVNITPILQAFSSGDKENRGVVVRSNQELTNFGILELWHFLSAPTGKKPKLRVTYTPPYL